MKALAVTVVAAALAMFPVYGMANDQAKHQTTQSTEKSTSTMGSASEKSSSSAGVDIDANVLAKAKVQQNGKDVGSVQKVLVNPSTGRIDHVDIKMTSGQNRTVSVPWHDLKVEQDSRGNVKLTMNESAASSPAASPKTSDENAGKNADKSGQKKY